MEKVDHLEGAVSAMEGKLPVVRNINNLLSRQLDEADSYSRESCMIITSYESPRKMKKRGRQVKHNIGRRDRSRDRRK